MHNETKMTQEKLKGRFNLLINPKLPMETKISKFLNEPIAFHLHKNRLFFEKLESKDDLPLTTKQILEKIHEEINLIARKSKRAMIWGNTRKKLPEWEDSDDYDEWGRNVKLML